ncbi:hypothetical protein QJS66_23155 [Kocuria rhizophila]|nr:hypothetical protein QJS66_23155 [Kocuria rhizophila]
MILGRLRDAYCRTVGRGVHARPGSRSSASRASPSWSADYQKPSARSSFHILERLERGEGPRDLPADQVRGTKRFSLEGGESLDPAAGRDHVRGRGTSLAASRASPWPTVAVSTCSPTLRASPTAQCSASSRGSQDPARLRGLRRREVPPGHRGRVHLRQRQRDPGVPGRETPPLGGRETVVEGIARARRDRARRRPEGNGEFRAAHPGPRRRRHGRSGHRVRGRADVRLEGYNDVAGPSTWWSTTRWASPPLPPRQDAPPRTPRTWPARCRPRSST